MHNPDEWLREFIGDGHVQATQSKLKRVLSQDELKLMQLQALLVGIEPKVKTEQAINLDELFKIDLTAIRVHPAVNEMLAFMNLPIIVPDWVGIITTRGWQITNLAPGRTDRTGICRSILITMREKPDVPPDQVLRAILEDNLARFKRFFDAEYKKRLAEGTLST